MEGKTGSGAMKVAEEGIYSTVLRRVRYSRPLYGASGLGNTSAHEAKREILEGYCPEKGILTTENVIVTRAVG